MGVNAPGAHFDLCIYIYISKNQKTWYTLCTQDNVHLSLLLSITQTLFLSVFDLNPNPRAAFKLVSEQGLGFSAEEGLGFSAEQSLVFSVEQSLGFSAEQVWSFVWAKKS